MSYILALDQGTTSSRAIVFGRDGRVVASAQQEFPQIFPGPALVEHDPEAIWSSQIAVAKEAIAKAGLTAADIAAIGIANQRETTVLWEKATGTPVANAIVWQSRVSAGLCDRLKQQGHEAAIRQKTGLVVDAYFSGTKVKHLLDTHDGLRARAARGEVLFGTIETFLLWRLTGGAVHVTDVSNASRTLLFNIHTLDWDDELLAMMDVPRAMLPAIRSNSEVYGHTVPEIFGSAIPIAGAAGDQQAALFGQACFEPGSAKNTYGTGCFLLMNTGATPKPSSHGLLTTVGWQRNGEVTYALEGAVFIAGAVVQWLRDGLKLIPTSADVERLMLESTDADGVLLVPAFVGLGAPYWDQYARGLIIGLTRNTTASHLARAAVESMAYQTRDVLDAMQQDSGITLSSLKVDGGATVNTHLLDFQADLLGVPVRRPAVGETTALGAAYLAGLAVGYWNDLDDVRRNWALDREFAPRIDQHERDRRYKRWTRAVARARDWARDDA
jgi:glycerol kinase